MEESKEDEEGKKEEGKRKEAEQYVDEICSISQKNSQGSALDCCLHHKPTSGHSSRP